MHDQVTLTIKAEAGPYTDTFNTNQKIKHIIQKTLHHFGIDESEYPKYELRLKDTILDLGASIHELGLNSTSELALILKAPHPDGGQSYA